MLGSWRNKKVPSNNEADSSSQAKKALSSRDLFLPRGETLFFIDFQEINILFLSIRYTRIERRSSINMQIHSTKSQRITYSRVMDYTAT